MLQQNTSIKDHEPKKTSDSGYEKDVQAASFLLVLAGLVVDQRKRKADGHIESRHLGQSLTDELGECMLHLIRESGKQGLKLPVVASKLEADDIPSLAIRDCDAVDGYWVDVADGGSSKPIVYSVPVKAYSSEDAGEG